MSETRQDPLKVGERMPGLTLPMLAGQPLDLRDLTGKKYILFMWASW